MNKTVIIRQESKTVTITPSKINVSLTTGKVNVAFVARQGPPGSQGEQGPPGEGVGVEVTAGTGGVQAFQVVMMANTGKIQAANGEEPSHAGRVVGMTTEAIAEDETGYCCQVGEITNPVWALTPGSSYYLVAGGEINLSPPNTGFIQQIGVSKNSTTLILQLGVPIKK